MRKTVALAKRELIEHRSGILTTPAVIMALMVLLTFGSILTMSGAEVILPTEGGMRSFNSVGDLFDLMAGESALQRAAIIITFLSALTLPALLLLPIVAFFIVLGGLYEERRDRSFLFWKSLPVSDTQEVLAKLAAGVVLAPAGFLLIAYAFQLLTLVLISLVGGLQGGSVGVVWQVGAILVNWLHSPFWLFMWVLWSLPIYAWVLFCSAYAPRAPFMYAVVPPVALIVVESVFLRSNVFAEWIGRHISAAPFFESYSRQQLGDVGDIRGPEQVAALVQKMATPDFGAIFESLIHADLWAGLAIAAALIYGAIWLRRYNL